MTKTSCSDEGSKYEIQISRCEDQGLKTREEDLHPPDFMTWHESGCEFRGAGYACRKSAEDLHPPNLMTKTRHGVQG